MKLKIRFICYVDYFYFFVNRSINVDKLLYRNKKICISDLVKKEMGKLYKNPSFKKYNIKIVKIELM